LRPWDKPGDDPESSLNAKTSSKLSSPSDRFTGSSTDVFGHRKVDHDSDEPGTSQRRGISQSRLRNAAKASKSTLQPNSTRSRNDDKLPDEDWERRRILSGAESPPGSPGINQGDLDLRFTNGVELVQSGQGADDTTDTQIRRNGDRTPAAINTLGLPPFSKASDNYHAGSPSTHHNLPTPISTSDTITKHHDPTSPSSTIGPYSTHTPNINTVSSDTSPDNEMQLGGLEGYDAREERQNAKGDVESHSDNKMLLEDPVSSADAQLRSEQKQAKGNRPTVIGEATDAALQASLTEQAALHGTDHLDEQDEAVGVSTPEEELQDTLDRDRRHFAQEPPNSDPQNIQPSHNSKGVHSSTSDSATVDSQDREPDIPTARRGPKEGLEELRIPRYSSPEDSSRGDASNFSSLRFSQTPTKATAASSTIRSPPERMITRVSSGALRHKSVSEILGVSERTPTSVPADRSGDVEMTDAHPLSSPTVQSGHIEPSSLAKLLQEERNSRDRPKRPTVVFGSKQEETEPFTRRRQSKEENDYLLTLFNAQASHPPRAMPLNALLASAPKTLTTANHYVDLHEQQDCRLLKKIYQFQYVDRWALRQRERCMEPPRQATHWDSLLSQMRWMQTDFKEERKWKITLAKSLADSCAAYVNGKQEDRTTMRVKIKNQKTRPISDSQLDMDTDLSDQPTSTPDLIASAGDGSISDAFEDEPTPDLTATATPADIFSLPLDQVMFGLEKTASSEQILSELPTYEPAGLSPDTRFLPDTTWQLPVIPVSRFLTGKIEIDNSGPPQKRCRFDYYGEDFGDDQREVLPPSQDDVALFNPESKHVLDRIHAGHAFRPPSEFPMPTQSFFEARNSSQWTPNEDDELRALVKEYHYNWSLISTLLTPSTLYTSGAERRTPWECFERWIGLEGLPAEMQKTAYFRTYSSRLANAQKVVIDQHQAQQAQNNIPNTPIRRQRTIQPVRVERRKNTKHLAIIDAMRKLAKKRESSLQKQQHGRTRHLNLVLSSYFANPDQSTAAGIQAMRKANEASQTRGPVSTPQDFSRIKHDRELKIHERQEAYRQTILASQKVCFNNQNILPID
jgi:chromatin modification-related protein VID21